MGIRWLSTSCHPQSVALIASFSCALSASSHKRNWNIALLTCSLNLASSGGSSAVIWQKAVTQKLTFWDNCKNMSTFYGKLLHFVRKERMKKWSYCRQQVPYLGQYVDIPREIRKHDFPTKSSISSYCFLSYNGRIGTLGEIEISGKIVLWQTSKGGPLQT